MHFKFRNVNSAFFDLVNKIASGEIPTIQTSSRVGNVLQVQEPVMITYSHPRERVLFNRARDANPFFHLFESLWMLAGRNDVKPLAFYNSNIVSYSDNGKVFNGPYGYRWREAMYEKWTSPLNHHTVAVDQLRIICEHLRKSPNSRRAVLQIWNVADDLLKIDTTKDNVCNTHVYFSVRDTFLDMTVCNRSNDLIWGMTGANAVHFSILQEYIASCVGIGVGVYNHMTNNLHAYVDRWEPGKWLEEEVCRTMHSPPRVNYSKLELVSLVEDPKQFDKDCKRFVNSIDQHFQEPFLRNVAQPMCAAFRAHKRRHYIGDNNALRIMERVHADDWRIAGTAWIEKRQRSWQLKNKLEQVTQRENLD